MRASVLLFALGLCGSVAIAQTTQPRVEGGTFSAPGYSTPAVATRPGTTGAAAAPGPAAAANGNASVSGPAAGLPPAHVQHEGVGAADPVNALRAAREPQRPSEFQRFVEQATGRLLSVFGTDFFAGARRGDARGDGVPVSGDYVIGPGDELVIRAWGSIDVDYRASVDRNGQISLPKVGTFNVTGIRASDIERHLRAQIGRVFTNFDLNATLGALRGVRVFVVGPAHQPGVYTLPGQSTLLSAVVAAGGPGPNGSMRRVLLRRDGRVASELDVYEFLVQGDKSRDLQLQAGDVVVFQPAGPRVALTGALDTPAIYELKVSDEAVRTVLRYAGGAPVLANPHRAQLERIDPARLKAARIVESFSLDEAGMQKPLRDGDVLTLLPISPQFANAVTLKGPVAHPLRYAHRPGMRVSDLIPDADALVSADFHRRKNLLVQLDEAHGAETPHASAARDSDRGPRRRAPSAPDWPPLATLFDEVNWDHAVIERLDPNDLSTQVIPFNLGRAVRQHDPVHDFELQPGDVVTVYSQKDMRVPLAWQTRLVSLEGEIAAPGVYQLQPGETMRGLLTRAGGLTPQAYVYGLEFSRQSTREQQRENLQAAMARLRALSATQSAREAVNRADNAAGSATISQAATQAQLARLSRIEPNGRIALELQPEIRSVEALPDVPLEHGDRIVVPPRPGFVTVAGAVMNNNAFLWKAGRTAGDYVRMAGLDEAADLSQMFVLRADGTAVSATGRRGFLGFGGVEAQELQPGDAVVVPNQLDYETFGRALVRNLKDWSQIFSQFGLGAAAIHTLRRN